MKNRLLLVLFMFGLVMESAFADPISLDLSFSGAAVTYDSGAQSLAIFIPDAAAGIDVLISSVSPYIPDTPAKGAGVDSGGNNGSVAGDDLRIHLNCGSSTRFRFDLLDATTGELFSGSDIKYDLLVYDIDGTETSVGGADVLTIYSSVEYTITANSALNVVIDEGTSVSFSDRDAGEVLGQVGLSQAEFEASIAQQNISVGLTFTQSSWEFEYTIANAGGDTFGTGRNLLFDAGDLTFTEATLTETLAVPEPMALSFLALSGLGLLIVKRIFVG